MPQRLVRWQASGLTHFLTFSCSQRLPYLSEPKCCDAVLAALEAARQRFDMRVYAFVLMPEHVHLMVSEPERGTLAEAMHFLKLSSSKRVRARRLELGESGPFWQKRYYDRNLRSYADFVEKLRYIHRNPVKRGLVQRPEDWEWSSFAHYATGSSAWLKSNRNGRRGNARFEPSWTQVSAQKQGANLGHPERSRTRVEGAFACERSTPGGNDGPNLSPFCRLHLEGSATAVS
jgi:putative transposase